MQAALDRVHAGRTTVVVAHRLTTIRNADLIVALKDGKVNEMGTHEELMKRRGLYYGLVESQLAGKDEEADAVEELPEDDEEATKITKNRPMSRKMSRQMTRVLSINSIKEEDGGESKTSREVFNSPVSQLNLRFSSTTVEHS